MSADITLAYFDSAHAALAKASSVDEVKSIRDKAQAMQLYLRQATASLEMQNSCATIKLRAERRLGELVAQLVPHRGGRPKRSHDGTVPRETLDSLGLNKNQSARWQQLAAIPTKAFDGYIQQAKSNPAGEEITTVGLLRAAGRQATVDAMGSSRSYEWFTPKRYIEPARRLMGEIALDPASCEEANATVGAARFFTLEQQGLSQKWTGSVWLNPPYGLSDDNKSNQAIWSASLLERFELGDVEQAVMLLNAATDASWFRPLWQHALCFVDHRIRFERPGGGPGPQPTHGNVLVYLGPQRKLFVREFAELGQVVVPSGNYSVAHP